LEHRLSPQSLGTAEKNTGMGSFNCGLPSQGKTNFLWSENSSYCCAPFTGTQWEFGSTLSVFLFPTSEFFLFSQNSLVASEHEKVSEF